MDKARLADALDGMTSRDLEALAAEIKKRLVKCIICGGDGAITVLAMTNRRSGIKATRAALLICMQCFEKHRLPEGRLKADAI